jgi:hypothetical protein
LVYISFAGFVICVVASVFAMLSFCHLTTPTVSGQGQPSENNFCGSSSGRQFRHRSYKLRLGHSFIDSFLHSQSIKHQLTTARQEKIPGRQGRTRGYRTRTDCHTCG